MIWRVTSKNNGLGKEDELFDRPNQLFAILKGETARKRLGLPMLMEDVS
jgi:hypothetical protein